MITIGMQVDWHFQELANNDRPTAAIGLEMSGIAVEQLLIDPREIDSAEIATDELEESARPVEYLPDTGRWGFLR